MQDISLHLLDIAENSVKAGADKIEILIDENVKENVLRLEITDNGSGMKDEIKKNVKDPFTTTRTERKIGLGLSLLSRAAEETGGYVEVESEEGKGTKVKAVFIYDHIDRKPLGNIGETIMTLLASSEKAEIKYTHRKNGNDFVFDSGEIIKELGRNAFNNSGVLIQIKELINSKLKEIS
jgi:anti-sigma regulatory factor (Ser/Thr protein kinase)